MEKHRSLLLAMLFVAFTGVSASCSAGSKGPDETPSEDETTASASPSAVDSHTYKGTGTRTTDFSEDKDKAVLSGEYEVRWEIADNRFEASNGDAREGPFELSLFCVVDPQMQDLDQFDLVNENLAEGSGVEKLSVPESQECQVNVVASDTGAWTVEIARK